MVDCLANTGFSAGLPLLLGIVLVLAGAVAAVVAFRRGSAGAALVIALAVIAVPLALGGTAAPASAATKAGCSSSVAAPDVPAAGTTPADSSVGAGGSTGGAGDVPANPVCTPLTDADVVIPTAGESYFTYFGADSHLFLDSTDLDSFQSALQGLQAQHPNQSLTAMQAEVYDVNRVFLRSVTLTLTPLDPSEASFPNAQMDQIVGNDNSLIVDFAVTYSYDDGCGASTSSDIAISTTWLD